MAQGRPLQWHNIIKYGELQIKTQKKGGTLLRKKVKIYFFRLT